MKNRKLKATFLIFLVLLMPIYSANVFAISIDVRATGTNDVFANVQGMTEGYVKSIDDVVINATIDTSGVSKDSVLFEGTTFDQCTSVGTNTNCIKRYRLTGSKGGIYTYSVSYSGTTKQGRMIVDQEIPKITDFSIIQEGIGKIILKYKVEDRAFNNSNKCADIKKIEFVVDNSVVKTLELNFTPSTNCKYPQTGLAEENLTVSGSGIINKKICIRAYDNLDQMGESCKTFLVDNAQPKPSNLRILDQGEPIRYVAPVRGAFPVTVAFDMEEKNLTKVYADLSELTDIVEFKSRYSNVEFECYPSDCNGKCTCESVNEIDMQRYSAGTITVPVHAEDASGNVVDVPLSLSLELDNVAPVVKSIETFVFGGKNYVGPKYNRIVARISESGSGFNKKLVYMDLSALMGQEYKTTVANDCVKEGEEWICSWDGFTVVGITDGITLPVTIIYPSQDDAGNLFAGESTVTVDSVAPELNVTDGIPQFYFASRGGPEGYPETIAKEGDCLNLVAVIKDRLPVRAFADFYYISGKGVVEGNCTGPVNGYSTCVWEPSYDTCPIRAGVDVKIPLTLIDLVYNNRTYEKDIKITVYGVETTAANYWNVQSDPVSPSAIDRQTVTLYYPFVYQPIHLKKITNKEAYPADIQIVNCTGDTNYLVGVDLISYLGYSGNDINDYPFYIKYTLERAVPTKDALNITCTLKIITKVNKRAISTPEYENATIVISYYNNPLGTLPSEIKEKIERTKRDNKLILSDLIGTLNDISQWAKSLCGIWYSISGIPSILSEIGDFLRSLEWVPYVGEAAKSAGVALTSTAGGMMTSLNRGWGEGINKVCNFMSCRVLDVLIKNNELYDFWVGQRNPSPLKFSWTVLEKDNSGKVTAKEKQVSFGINNVEESIVFSTLSLCIPGILNFLQKWRSIDCWYICCLKEAQKGFNTYACEKGRSIMTCKFVYGQIFNSLPFTWIWEKFSKAVQSTFATKGAYLINIAATHLCETQCTNPTTIPFVCSVCITANLVETILQLACDYLAFGENCVNLEKRFKSIDSNKICKEAMKEEPCTF